jgi:hypothetical protein
MVMSEERLRNLISSYDLNLGLGMTSAQIRVMLKTLSTDPWTPLMDSLIDAVCEDCSSVASFAFALGAL